MNKHISNARAATPIKFPHDYSLENSVRQAIFSHTEFSLFQVITQDNKQKYHDISQPMRQHDYLNEVFQTMAALNEQGLHTENLGRMNQDGLAFRDALLNICKNIATEFGGQPLVYVELGPEPIKTRLIIETLLQLQVKIKAYVAVDVNPASEKHMRPLLSELLPDIPSDFVTSLFEDFRLDTYLGKNTTPALITMLGFQEGNDDPHIMTGWLSDIARSDDILLSEIQLFDPRNAAQISEFYANPLMQRFSRIAFEQAIAPNIPSLNRFFLLPVEMLDNTIIYTAIMGEEYINKQHGRCIFISNYCLKFAYSQYRKYRELDQYFKITNEMSTDDATLLFQLSRRR